MAEQGWGGEEVGVYQLSTERLRDEDASSVHTGREVKVR